MAPGVPAAACHETMTTAEGIRYGFALARALALSLAVLRLWQSLLIAHRLSGASVPPSDFGMRWSTSVAGRTRAVFTQSQHWHRWRSRLRIRLRSLSHSGP